MDDQCGWTETKLVHEIISNLESLQGVLVEWRSMGPHGSLQEFVRFSTLDEQVFRFGITFIYDDESAEAFDDKFELI